VLPLVLYDGTGRVAVIVRQYKVVDDYTVFLWLDVLDRAVLWQGGRDRATGNIVSVTEPYRIGRGEHKLLVRSSLGWRAYPYLVLCSGRCAAINTMERPVYRIPGIRGSVTMSLSSGVLKICSNLKPYNIPSGLCVSARWSVNTYDCSTYGFLGAKTMGSLSGCMELGVGDRDCVRAVVLGDIVMSHGYQNLWDMSVRIDRRVYRGVPVGVTVDRKWYEPLERLVGVELVLKPTIPVSREALQPHVSPVTSVAEKGATPKPVSTGVHKLLLPLVLVGGTAYLLGRRKKR